MPITLPPEAPPEVPPEVAILIIIPYFVAVIGAIIHTNKQIKKGSHKDENSAAKTQLVTVTIMTEY